MFALLRLPLFLTGLVIWAGATIALRVAGQHLIYPGRGIKTLVLFALSFPLMAWMVRRLCRRFQLPRDQWLAGAVSLALPALLLDAFSSAFFPAVFPNMVPQAAGVFGGWMMWCCGGALLGVVLFPGRRP